jgi:hypothetical protein
MTKRTLPRRFGFVKEKGKAKRWRNVGNRAFAKGVTISDRQMSNLAREERLGQRMSKEAYTKAIRKREVSYADEATRLRQTNARNSRFIREYLPDIAQKDKAVALKFYHVRYEGLSPAEKRRFGEMFRRYSADNVRQALGSAQVTSALSESQHEMDEAWRPALQSRRSSIRLAFFGFARHPNPQAA